MSGQKAVYYICTVICDECPCSPHRCSASCSVPFTVLPNFTLHSRKLGRIPPKKNETETNLQQDNPLDLLITVLIKRWTPVSTCSSLFTTSCFRWFRYKRSAPYPYRAKRRRCCHPYNSLKRLAAWLKFYLGNKTENADRSRLTHGPVAPPLRVFQLEAGAGLSSCTKINLRIHRTNFF